MNSTLRRVETHIYVRLLHTRGATLLVAAEKPTSEPSTLQFFVAMARIRETWPRHPSKLPSRSIDTATLGALSFECLSCSHTTSAPLTGKWSDLVDVKRRSVLAARTIGCGRASLVNFCGVMNLPPPVQPTVQLSVYARHQKIQLDTAETVFTAGTR